MHDRLEQIKTDETTRAELLEIFGELGISDVSDQFQLPVLAQAWKNNLIDKACCLKLGSNKLIQLFESDICNLITELNINVNNFISIKYVDENFAEFTSADVSELRAFFLSTMFRIHSEELMSYEQLEMLGIMSESTYLSFLYEALNKGLVDFDSLYTEKSGAVLDCYVMEKLFCAEGVRALEEDVFVPSDLACFNGSVSYGTKNDVWRANSIPAMLGLRSVLDAIKQDRSLIKSLAALNAQVNRKAIYAVYVSDECQELVKRYPPLRIEWLELTSEQDSSPILMTQDSSYPNVDKLRREDGIEAPPIIELLSTKNRICALDEDLIPILDLLKIKSDDVAYLQVLLCDPELSALREYKWPLARWLSFDIHTVQSLQNPILVELYKADKHRFDQFVEMESNNPGNFVFGFLLAYPELFQRRDVPQAHLISLIKESVTASDCSKIEETLSLQASPYSQKMQQFEQWLQETLRSGEHKSLPDDFAVLKRYFFEGFMGCSPLLFNDNSERFIADFKVFYKVLKTLLSDLMSELTFNKICLEFLISCIKDPATLVDELSNFTALQSRLLDEVEPVLSAKGEGLARFITTLNKNQYELRTILSSLKLKSTEIGDGARSTETWSEFVFKLLGFFDTSRLPTESEFSRELKDHLEEGMVAEESEYSEFVDKDQWTPYKVLGRTLILQHKERRSFIAIKCQKTGESPQELVKQFKTVQYYRKQKHYKFEGSLPTPRAVANITNRGELLQWFKEEGVPDTQVFESLTSDGTTAYIYEHPNYDYFEYVYANEEKFFSALGDASPNIFNLLSRGLVLDSLSDAFHNTNTTRADGGRYIAWANGFLANAMRSVRFRGGGGRVDNWPQAVHTTDIRSSGGPADESDSEFINNIVGKDIGFFSGDLKHLNTAFNTDGFNDNVDSVIIMNFIVEYLMVFELLLGRHMNEFTNKDWEEQVGLLIRVYAKAYTAFTGVAPHNALRLMKQLFDVKHYARQMKYWMTKEYVDDIANKKIPADIHGAASVSFKPFRPGTFDDQIGFTADGINQSLGATNGQYPIKHGERGRILLGFFMLAHRQAQQQYQAQFDQIMEVYVGRLVTIRQIIKQSLNSDDTDSNLEKFSDLLFERICDPFKVRFLTTKQLIDRLDACDTKQQIENELLKDHSELLETITGLQSTFPMHTKLLTYLEHEFQEGDGLTLEHMQDRAANSIQDACLRMMC